MGLGDLTLTGSDDLLSPDGAGLAAPPEEEEEEETSAGLAVVGVASKEAAVDRVPFEAAADAPGEAAPDPAAPDAAVAGAGVSVVEAAAASPQ